MLVGLVFMILGVALWVVAAQAARTAAAPHTQTPGHGMSQSWATRASGGISFVVGFVLFALRTTNAVVLVGLSLLGLVLSFLAARRGGEEN